MTPATKRLHGKAQLDPEAYTYRGSYDASPPPPLVIRNDYGQYLAIPSESPAEVENKKRLRALLAESGRSDTNCTHCGANIRYVFVYWHEPTGEHIAVGQQCDEERMGAGTRQEMDARIMQKNAAARAEAYRMAAKAQAWVAAHETLAAQMLDNRGDDFVRQMIHVVSKYGELTERQEAAVVKSIARVAQWTTPGAVCELREVVEAPAGKGITVEGEVTKAEFRETQYGARAVMTVKDDAGWYAWGTVPQSLIDAAYELPGYAATVLDKLVGKRVRFVATLERGDKPNIVFTKRPTAASIVEAA